MLSGLMKMGEHKPEIIVCYNIDISAISIIFLIQPRFPKTRNHFL